MIHGDRTDAARSGCRPRRWIRASAPGGPAPPSRRRSYAPGASSPACAPRCCCSSCSRWRPCPARCCPSAASDPTLVDLYIAHHPTARARSSTGSRGFDVFAAPWFAAIYALLFISLIGCLIPRIRLHARALLRRPPKAPAHPGAAPLPASASRPPRRRRRCSSRPAAVLRGRRFRVASDDAIGQRREGLPARDRQPDVPRLAASSCWRGSRSAACSATRARSSSPTATASPTPWCSTTASTTAGSSTPISWRRSRSS